MSLRKTCGAVATALVLAAVGGTSPVFAQAHGAPAPIDPERLALARTYLQQTHMADNIRAGLARSVVAIAPPGSPAAQDPKRRQMVLSLTRGMQSVGPDISEGLTRAVAGAFTAKELKDLVAFYGSPTGQAMMVKMPVVMQDVGPIMKGLMPKITKVAEQDFCSHLTCTADDRARFAKMGRPNVAPH